jgi:sulfate permease, SulP family
VLRGVLPVRRSMVAGDVAAGLTLAVLGIPEVLGYARIAGMPVQTGLYTLLLPMAAFAVLGASRHLVVGADSATAAILAAALTGLAAVDSPRYVQLAGLAALLTGGLLLLARVARLGFLANFLARTVLVGFLTGVGIQVAVSQLPGMLGITQTRAGTGPGTLIRFIRLLAGLPRAQPWDVAIAAGVIAVMLGTRLVGRRIPGALIAIVGAIILSHLANLDDRGVATVGPVPSALPHLGLPALGLNDAEALVGAVLSMFVVIVAQSAATSRAYAAKYREALDDETDLVGLGAANIAAAFSGTFVVNGAVGKTQIVDSAGGRSQLAQLVTSAVVLLTLLLLTGLLTDLPIAALAAVVFLIGIRLVDVAGMRRLLAVRPTGFAIALVTAAAVVVLGVRNGIILAVAVSIIDHLRHTYHPLNTVLVKSVTGHWEAVPVTPGARTEPGLVIYRFGTTLYYANASRLLTDIDTLSGTTGEESPAGDESPAAGNPGSGGEPLRWLVLDCVAIGDVDYTAGLVLSQVIEQLHDQHVCMAISGLLEPVRRQLDRYGISGKDGPDAYYQTPGHALDAYHAAAVK